MRILHLNFYSLFRAYLINTDDLKRFRKVDSYSFLENNKDIYNQFPALLSPDGEENQDLIYCYYCGIYEVDEIKELCKSCEDEFPVISKKLHT